VNLLKRYAICDRIKGAIDKIITGPTTVIRGNPSFA